MSNIKFTNFAATTLASGINSVVTSLTVATGTGALFPTLVGAEYFFCVLADAATGNTREVVKVTARSTDTFTITRAQDSTTGQTYATGDKVELRLTAAGIATLATTETAQTFTGVQTFAAPILGTPTSATLTNATGLPISTGVSGLGTNVATALATNVGTAGAPVVNGGVLGTPSSGTVTNLTGTASININGTVGANVSLINTGAFTSLSSTIGANFATSSGNVGIGNNAPVSVLSLANAGGDISMGTYNGLTNGQLVHIGLGGNSGSWADNSGTASMFFTKTDVSSSNAIGFVTYDGSSGGGGNTTRMYINNLGRVGIGTTAPTTKLHVDFGNTANNAQNLLTLTRTGTSANAAASLVFDLGGATNNTSATIQGFRTEGGGAGGTDLIFSTANAATLGEKMRITATGRVGINTGATVNYALEVSTDSAGKPGVGGLWTVVSDERIKSDIVPANLDRCYEIVKSVPLKYFGFAPGVYTDDQIQDKHNLGWIAQDVQKVFKNAVSVKPFTLKTDIPDGTEEYEEQDFTLEVVEKTETSIQVINGKAVQVSKVVKSDNKILLFDTVDVVDEAGAAVLEEYEVTPAVPAVAATDEIEAVEATEETEAVEAVKAVEAVEAIPAVMGIRPVTYQMPRMITKTRPKVRHNVIEDCLDLNGAQMLAALYGAVQALMEKVETLENRLTLPEAK